MRPIVIAGLAKLVRRREEVGGADVGADGRCGEVARGPVRASAKITRMRPAVATTSASRCGQRRPIGGRPRDRWQAEHEVREHRAGDAADDLGGHVAGDIEPRAGCRAVRRRAETTGLKCAPDTGAKTRISTVEPERRGDRVLEQLQPGIGRRELLGGDARADRRPPSEQRAAEELAGDAAHDAVGGHVGDEDLRELVERAGHELVVRPGAALASG